jgi:hypothetical protein
MTTTDELLDSKSAAAVLSISTKHLTKLRDRGLLPVVKISDSRRGIRYSRKALEKFIAERSCKPAPAKSK